MRNLSKTRVWGPSVIMVGGSLAVAAACGSPFQTAAPVFAKAASQGATAVATAPATIVNACWSYADTDFLATRLEVLKVSMYAPESVAVIENSNISWTDWRTKGMTGTATKRSWTTYCQEFEKTTDEFAVGVSAITSYATSIETLAQSGTPIGGDLSGLDGDLATLSTTLGDSSLATVAKGMSGAISDVSAILVGGIVEKDLKTYATKADGPITKLVDSLDAYLVVAAGIVDAWANRENNVVSFMNALALHPPGAPDAGCPAAPVAPTASAVAPHGHAPPPPGNEILLKLEEISARQCADQARFAANNTAALTPAMQTAGLLSFYDRVHSADTAIDQARTSMAGYRKVLAQIKAAHNTFVNADKNDESF
jgi:hypothetical protein